MAEEKKCQAKTSEGDSCNNPAKFPKDNPIACHIKSHQKQLGVLDEVEDEVKEKAEEIIDRTKKHIFSSDVISHVVYVDYPEEDEREQFRAEFTGGKYETNDNEKAKLLQESIEKSNTLSRKIEKIQ